jgi:hypothetical protein
LAGLKVLGNTDAIVGDLKFDLAIAGAESMSPNVRVVSVIV